MQSASQAAQDIFPRTVLVPHTGAVRTYLDVGASHPTYISNTVVLEMEGWYGVSMDIVDAKGLFDQFGRKNPFVCADATQVDWEKLFDKYPVLHDGYLDYLSFDVDDATIPAFDHFPFDKVKCSVITIEHDAYRVGPQTRNYIRERLLNLGYMLVCEDVICEGHGEFEDWWVYPSPQVNMDIVSKLKWKSMPAGLLAKMMIQLINH